MNLKIIIFLITISSSLSVVSQKEIEFESPIKERIINNFTGTLLVKTKNSLSAINAKTREISWTNNELRKVSFSDYSEIPYTPIVLFDQKPLINSKILTSTLNSKGVSRKMLNVVTGKVLFDSEKQGYKAVSKTLLLPKKKAILVEGIKNKELTISLYSFVTGKQLWQTKKSDFKFFTNLKVALFDNEKILLDAQQNIYWLKNKQLIKIDGKTGDILFEKEEISSIAMNASKKILFVFSEKLAIEKLDEENLISAVNTRTQKSIWKTPLKIWGNISNTILVKGSMVVITSKGFNIINIKKGTKIWEQSEPLPLIKKIVPVHQGFLVVQDNYLLKINSKGKKAWEEKLKITNSANENPIYIIEDAKQVLYITPTEANKVDPKKGTKIWKNTVVLNPAGFVSRNLKLSEHYFKVWNDSKNKLFPLYNNSDFYLFNPKDLKEPVLIETLGFKKTIPNLKIRDKGYFLYKNNLFYFFETSGALKYKKEYPYHPNSNLFSESLYWAQRGIDTFNSAIGFMGNQVTKTLNSVLVSQDLGLISNVSSSIYGTYQSYQNSIDDLTKINQLDIDSSLDAIFNRIKAGRNSDKSILMVVPKEEDTDIIRLDIDSGKDEVLKTIKNTFKNFLVDQVEEQIYFFEKKKIIINTINK
jgi:hypothetical protein